MIHNYKYDIAFSVAEEDLNIADEIAKELTKYGIEYYLYPQHRATNWGKHLLDISWSIYGKQTRYVLMITSEVFVTKYWAVIEKQISDINSARRRYYILQLRLDDTPVSGMSKYIVSEQWNNNPAELAGIISEKLKREKGGKKVILFTVMFITAILMLLNPKPQQHLSKDSISQQDTAGNAAEKRGHNTEGLIYREATFAERVPVKNFYISSTEVTFAQYAEYCLKNNKTMPFQQQHQPPGLFPVANVSWYEAMDYCRWAGGRLPRETEWEYSASAGLPLKYSGGNNAAEVAIYNQRKASKIMLRKPNFFGLYDMTGNVAEWCQDWYGRDSIEKVVRGGAYNNLANELAITRRNKLAPDQRSYTIGFRVVWDKK